MTIQKKRLLNSLLPATLTLLLLGCASTPQQPAASVNKALKEYRSASQARQEAIDQAELEKVLTENSEEQEPLDETAALLLDDDSAYAAETDAEEIIPAPSATQNNDIWPRLRAGFSLPDKDHPQVVADEEWFVANQSYLDRTFERATPYFHHIVEQIEKRGMPLELALLPVVESAYQPFAYSHGSAAGIWQFIPGTAQNFGLKIDWWYDGRRDIKASTEAALNYLDALQKRFDGDWLLALAAYNSGEGTVSRAIASNQRQGKGTRFWDLDLPSETRDYVPRLLAIAAIVAAPEKFGVSLLPIDDSPYLTSVNIGSQLDLAIAADLAGISQEELYLLNPAFNRWATSPNGPHRLLLPLDKSETFKQKLAQLPQGKRLKWVRHRIKSGETISQIADQYKTTVSAIQHNNKLRGNAIRAGEYLIIPAPSQTIASVAANAETAKQSSKQENKTAANKRSYSVRAGDTLWDIAIAHKTTVKELAQWNGISTKESLRPGQKLVIWSEDSRSVIAAQSEQPSHPLAQAVMRKINYRVRSGDSLAGISERFKVSVENLKQWNPDLSRSKYIQPGQTLVVYVDVTKLTDKG